MTSAENNLAKTSTDEQPADVLFLEDQLHFILKISTDIAKTTDTILS